MLRRGVCLLWSARNSATSEPPHSHFRHVTPSRSFWAQRGRLSLRLLYLRYRSRSHAPAESINLNTIMNLPSRAALVLRLTLSSAISTHAPPQRWAAPSLRSVPHATRILHLFNLSSPRRIPSQPLHSALSLHPAIDPSPLRINVRQRPFVHRECPRLCACTPP